MPSSTRDIDIYEISRDAQNTKQPMHLKIVDTVGFGDCQDLSTWKNHIMNYIESKVMITPMVTLKSFASTKRK